MTLRNWERAKVAALIAGGALLGASLKSYLHSDASMSRPIPRQPTWRHGVYGRAGFERRRMMLRALEPRI